VKLARVQQVLDSYRGRSNDLNRRMWVCRKAGVTSKWFTRALNEGHLSFRANQVDQQVYP
jgi:hypothetical protein